VNAANEIQTIDSSPTVTYDRAGNMTSDGTLNYQYDAWNRLVRVTSNGNWNVNGYIYYADYAYDGLNRRIEKVVYRGSMMLPVEHYYYNQNWQMLEHRTVVDPFGTCGSTEYIWSPRYVDSPIVRFHSDVYHPQYNNVRYYATDANHNVTATIDAATGDVVNRYSYTAYGKATEYDASWSNAAAPTSDGPLYCGYFVDAETSNYCCRNRYLSTALGTFINRDPIGYSGGADLYIYAYDDPIAYVDPFGFIPEVVNVGHGGGGAGGGGHGSGTANSGGGSGGAGGAIGSVSPIIALPPLAGPGAPGMPGGSGVFPPHAGSGMPGGPGVPGVAGGAGLPGGTGVFRKRPAEHVGEDSR
jgi:RHS repeat-associated protein